MEQVVLIIHIILAIAIVVLVLLQRSEGGALGIGGGGTLGGFVSGQSAANLLTRATAILAACFMGTSIMLTIMAGGASKERSIIDDLQNQPPASNQPAAPAQPSVPTSQ